MKTAAVNFFLLFVALAKGQRMPNFNQTGITFVQQYYTQFDGPLRTSVRTFYENTDSVLVSGGEIFYGADAIIQKFSSMMAITQRNIIATDCQPTKDAGLIINVFGRVAFNDPSKTLSSNSNSTVWFNEMFVLKPRVTSLYVENQYFRASVWNMTSTSTNNSNFLVFV